MNNLLPLVTNFKRIISLKPHKVIEENKKIGWLNVSILTMFLFFWFLITGASALYSTHTGIDGKSIPLYQELFFGKNNSKFTFFTSLFLIGDIFGLILVGFLADLISIKKFTLVNGFITGILLFALNFTHSGDLACTLAFFIGMFLGSVMVVPNMRLVFQWFSKKNVAVPMAYMIAISTFGGILIMLVGPQLIEHIGDASVLWFITITFFILWLATWFISEKECDYKLQKRTPKMMVVPIWASIKSVLSNPKNYFIGLILSFLNLPIAIFAWSNGSQWISNFYDKIPLINGNSGSTYIPIVLSIFLFGAILGTLFFGKLANYFGYRKIFLYIGGILTIVFSSLLLIGNALTFYGLAIVLFFVGFFSGCMGICYTMIGENNKEQDKGLSSSLLSIIMVFVGAGFQNLFQFLRNGPASNSLFVCAIIFPIMILIAMFLVTLLKETGTKHRQLKVFARRKNEQQK